MILRPLAAGYNECDRLMEVEVYSWSGAPALDEIIGGIILEKKIIFELNLAFFYIMQLQPSKWNKKRKTISKNKSESRTDTRDNTRKRKPSDFLTLL